MWEVQELSMLFQCHLIQDQRGIRFNGTQEMVLDGIVQGVQANISDSH
jgi:hypothetical protein